MSKFNRCPFCGGDLTDSFYECYKGHGRWEGTKWIEPRRESDKPAPRMSDLLDLPASVVLGGMAPTPAARVLKLPTDSKRRKEIPLWTIIEEYFPDAFIGMASLSYKANEKHNPGQPMHWSREKSGDHKNCIARHLLDEERIDPETGEPEAVAAAWRACANAQLVIERMRAAGTYPTNTEK